MTTQEALIHVQANKVKAAQLGKQTEKNNAEISAMITSIDKHHANAIKNIRAVR